MPLTARVDSTFLFRPLQHCELAGTGPHTVFRAGKVGIRISVHAVEYIMSLLDDRTIVILAGGDDTLCPLEIGDIEKALKKVAAAFD